MGTSTIGDVLFWGAKKANRRAPGGRSRRRVDCHNLHFAILELEVLGFCNGQFYKS